MAARFSGGPRSAVNHERPTPASSEAAAPAPPRLTELRETDTKAETINAILTRIAQLAEKTESLNTRLDQVEVRKPEPPAELAELRAELGRLSATAGDLAVVPGEVRQVDDRVKNLSATLKNVHDELAALRARTEKLAASAAAPVVHDSDRAVTLAAAEEASSTPHDLATELQGGMKLLRRNRFKEALGVFNRLELTNPDDARVWYYAALSLGFATNQWTGGTLQLVEKGIERERAGTPSVNTIDAAFSDLPPTLGRDWLAEYRRRAASQPEAASTATPPADPGDQGRKSYGDQGRKG